MIVGTKYIDQAELLKHCMNLQMLKDYCELLVPRVVRHQRAILDNQKYLVALYVRDFKSLTYTDRKELCEGLLKDVSVTGIANTIYDFEDLISNSNIEKLARYIREGVER